MELLKKLVLVSFFLVLSQEAYGAGLPGHNLCVGKMFFPVVLFNAVPGLTSEIQGGEKLLNQVPGKKEKIVAVKPRVRRSCDKRKYFQSRDSNDYKRINCKDDVKELDFESNGHSIVDAQIEKFVFAYNAHGLDQKFLPYALKKLRLLLSATKKISYKKFRIKIEGILPFNLTPLQKKKIDACWDLYAKNVEKKSLLITNLLVSLINSCAASTQNQKKSRKKVLVRKKSDPFFLRDLLERIDEIGEIHDFEDLDQQSYFSKSSFSRNSTKLSDCFSEGSDFLRESSNTSLEESEVSKEPPFWLEQKNGQYISNPVHFPKLSSAR